MESIVNHPLYPNSINQLIESTNDRKGESTSCKKNALSGGDTLNIHLVQAIQFQKGVNVYLN